MQGVSRYAGKQVSRCEHARRAYHVDNGRDASARGKIGKRCTVCRDGCRYRHEGPRADKQAYHVDNGRDASAVAFPHRPEPRLSAQVP